MLYKIMRQKILCGLLVTLAVACTLIYGFGLILVKCKTAEGCLRVAAKKWQNLCLDPLQKV